jgi:branched-chain amino acid transport system ATP-binding protein
MLVMDNVEVMYGNVILVLKGVSLEVSQGHIVLLLGANGAGKSTTLKAISGLLYSETGKITSGNITFENQSIKGIQPDKIVKHGIVQVQEGRKIFEHFSVEEELKVGAYAAGISIKTGNIKDAVDKVYAYFPRLQDLKKRTCGYLSGGEQQMLVMGRALVANPKLMLLDEPSLGLSPILVKEIFHIIKRINTEEKTAILLVEQNAAAALSIGHYGYVMENGHIVMAEPAQQLKRNEDIKEFYLGLSNIGVKKSYREVKHYKRRKRWLA